MDPIGQLDHGGGGVTGSSERHGKNGLLPTRVVQNIFTSPKGVQICLPPTFQIEITHYIEETIINYGACK